MNFEEKLSKALEPVLNSRVKESMAYSLLAGGKRLRPMFLYEVLKGYGCDPEIGDYFACAIEMIHTYSLIHDDLPAMDNDDLRRGKPTNHKQFDEATAILAGDGLLTYAFEYASKTDMDAETVLKGIRFLANKAGSNGMIYGQDLDTLELVSDPDLEAINRVHNYKTGCLFSLPLMIGALLAKQPAEVIQKWESIGEKIGLAFQVQDDILDVEKTAYELGKTNSDVRNQKNTSVSLLGIENAKSYMNQLYEESIQAIQEFEGFDATGLINSLKGVEERNL
ncbi:MAG: polyprenyl synthetase family protein [Solobacterium sp.]|nr:polyprenyl synthetase family protein [Solobacterium sp.]